MYESDDKILKEKNRKIAKTNYFLVGGFDIKKCRGVIKLYKLIYGKENNDKIKIKYIDEASVDRGKNFYFKSFRGAISCITQLEKTGNILIGCWDGNVYVINPPNIKAYENEIINLKYIVHKYQ